MCTCLNFCAMQLGEGGGEVAGSKQFYLISQVSFQLTSKKCREELKSQRERERDRERKHDRERVEIEGEKDHPLEKAGQAQKRDWEIMEDTKIAQEWKGIQVREENECLKRIGGSTLAAERQAYELAAEHANLDTAEAQGFP